MRHLTVWLIEFFRLVARRRLHPLVAQCPVCQQMVRLHVDKAGRRHIGADPLRPHETRVVCFWISGCCPLCYTLVWVVAFYDSLLRTPNSFTG